jgi:hypothetical protein
MTAKCKPSKPKAKPDRTERPLAALNFRQPQQPAAVEPVTIPQISWGPEGGLVNG